MRLLAISSSRVGQSAYLESAAPVIHSFLGKAALKIAFIPFAAADGNYAGYLHMVNNGLSQLPYTIEVANQENAVDLLERSDAIMVGGGNTFKLLHDLYALNIFEIIQRKVLEGTPYVAWSAGSNITGRSISTTNDMPIIEPHSFKALGFFPFQINPHYLNVKPEGFHGETRDQRLTEFLLLNPTIPIVALPEGTALLLQDNKLTFEGKVRGKIFTADATKKIAITDIAGGQNLNFLL